MRYTVQVTEVATYEVTYQVDEEEAREMRAYDFNPEHAPDVQTWLEDDPDRVADLIDPRTGDVLERTIGQVSRA